MTELSQKSRRRKWLPHALGAGVSALLIFLGGAAAEFLSDEVKAKVKPYNKYILGFFIVIALWEAIRAFRVAREPVAQETATSQTGLSIGGDATNSPITTGDNNEVSQAQHDFVKGNKTEIHHHHHAPESALRNSQSAINPLHQLPTAPELVGRDTEINELLAKLNRGVTISASVQGQGGVGKTALALVLAHRLQAKYPDAQFYLDLQGVTNPLTPAQAMAHVIRAYHPEAQLPNDEAALGGIYRSVLHEKKALLLWDNARDKAQIEPLRLPEGCLMIVTSRQQFALPWLYAKALHVLPRDQSIALLRKLAERSSDAADRIAELCGDLPYALTLAASAIAETPNLTVTRYIEKLAAQRLQMLDGVAASLRLSYELLSASQQEHWRTLSVFPVTFDEAAAAAVWNIEADAANDVLSELIKFSLVEFDDQTNRYRLHDLVREFARECTNDIERARFSQRHAAHYCAVLREAGDLYEKGGAAVMQGMSLYDQERENILVGQAWAAAHSGNDGDKAAAQFCIYYPGTVGMNNVLNLRLHLRERIAWLEAQLAAARRLLQRDYESAALGNLGSAYADLGETRKAIMFFEQQLVIVREIGDRKGEGTALGNLGAVFCLLGKPHKAIGFQQQQLDIAHEIGDDISEGDALNNLGNSYLTLGDISKSLSLFEQRLAHARRIGDRVGEISALGNIGVSYRKLNQPMIAIQYQEERLGIVREIGDRRREGETIGNIGAAFIQLGEIRKAITYFEQALMIHRETGLRRGQSDVLGNLGNAYYLLGEAHKAVEFYNQQLVISREIGDRRGEGNTLWNLSLVVDKLGDHTQTIANAEAALKIYEAIEDPYAEKVRRKLAEWRNE